MIFRMASAAFRQSTFAELNLEMFLEGYMFWHITFFNVSEQKGGIICLISGIRLYIGRKVPVR